MAVSSLLALIVAANLPAGTKLDRYEFSGIEMAVPVRMVLYAPSETQAKAASKAAFARIRELNGVMSDYDPTSEVRRLAATAGTGQTVKVSDDLWRVLQASDDLSKRSHGAFDVTVGPFVRLWRRARRRQEMPTAERIEQFRTVVGHQYMKLDEAEKTVRLTRPEMWIDLGGIAKGDAIDAALQVLKEHGINSALVDAGGDIGLTDAPPGRDGWVIGVAALERDAGPSIYLRLSNVAIATSGDTWQFVEIDGRRYSHLVDPYTGIGLTDHSSVTVIAPDAMTADGLASAVSVLGPKQGIELIDVTKDVAACVIRAPRDRAETYHSRRWKNYPIVNPATLAP